MDTRNIGLDFFGLFLLFNHFAVFSRSEKKGWQLYDISRSNLEVFKVFYFGQFEWVGQEKKLRAQLDRSPALTEQGSSMGKRQ